MKEWLKFFWDSRKAIAIIAVILAALYWNTENTRENKAIDEVNKFASCNEPLMTDGIYPPGQLSNWSCGMPTTTDKYFNEHCSKNTKCWEYLIANKRIDMLRKEPRNIITTSWAELTDLGNIKCLKFNVKHYNDLVCALYYDDVIIKGTTHFFNSASDAIDYNFARQQTIENRLYFSECKRFTKKMQRMACEHFSVDDVGVKSSSD